MKASLGDKGKGTFLAEGRGHRSGWGLIWFNEAGGKGVERKEEGGIGAPFHLLINYIFLLGEALQAVVCW